MILCFVFMTADGCHQNYTPKQTWSKRNRRFHVLVVNHSKWKRYIYLDMLGALKFAINFVQQCSSWKAKFPEFYGTLWFITAFTRDPKFIFGSKPSILCTRLHCFLFNRHYSFYDDLSIWDHIMNYKRFGRTWTRRNLGTPILPGMADKTQYIPAGRTMFGPQTCRIHVGSVTAWATDLLSKTS